MLELARDLLDEVTVLVELEGVQTREECRLRTGGFVEPGPQLLVVGRLLGKQVP